MIVVMGLSLIFLIWSRIGWPQPGFFVSPTVMPSVRTKTAVLPPPPLSIQRLSRSFSTSTTRGAAAGGCWNAATPSDREPTVTRAARKVIRFMARIILDLGGSGLGAREWGKLEGSA